MLLPWEGERTKKLIEQLEVEMIEIYSETFVNYEHEKISKINYWNIFDNVDQLKNYFDPQKENCYFDLGSHFLQFNKYLVMDKHTTFSSLATLSLHLVLICQQKIGH